MIIDEKEFECDENGDIQIPFSDHCNEKDVIIKS